MRFVRLKPMSSIIYELFMCFIDLLCFFKLMVDFQILTNCNYPSIFCTCFYLCVYQITYIPMLQIIYTG